MFLPREDYVHCLQPYCPISTLFSLYFLFFLVLIFSQNGFSYNSKFAWCFNSQKNIFLVEKWCHSPFLGRFFESQYDEFNFLMPCFADWINRPEKPLLHVHSPSCELQVIDISYCMILNIFILGLSNGVHMLSTNRRMFKYSTLLL